MEIENKNRTRRLILLVLVVWLPMFVLLLSEPLVRLADGRLISQKTGIVNFCGVVCIILGIFLKRFLLNDRLRHHVHEPWRPRTDLIALAILLFLALLGAYISVLTWREYGVDPLSVGDRTLYEMNVIYANEERVISGLPGRFTAMALIGLLYSLYLRREKRIRRTTAGVCALLFLVSMISPRRALLLSAMISAVMMWFLSQEKIKILQIIRVAIPVSLIVLFFGFTQYILQKNEDFSLSSSTITIIKYYLHSFYVMDALIDTSHFDTTAIVLSVPERITSIIFGYTPNVDLSIPFVYVPDPANTVPCFYYFYKSAGFFGVVTFSLVIGWVFMSLYSDMKIKPSLYNTVASSLFATGIVLSPRQCIFIEYDFIFILGVTFLLNWLRVSPWRRTDFCRVSMLH